MPTLRLDLEYDGSQFRGWAQQPGQRTVEGELRVALEPLLSPGYGLTVAGRTDAGVHARGQVVSLTAATAPDPGRLRRALDARLPPDISVRDLRAVAAEFDARRDARARRYEYRVLTGRSALRRACVLYHPAALDLERLRAAARITRGQHNFRAFTPTQTQHVFFDRTVIECDWVPRDDEIIFHIAADAFLRHMVRVMVGTQLLVGRGAWSLERYSALLTGAPRAAAGPTAPPHALSLVGVDYADPAEGGP